ncbi:hypothetical protein GJAV_G00225260 [Gymnothorax javanicus]|nr:hypothetical protein GJAV_G00225260 [Gymnothorax javanicus]
MPKVQVQRSLSRETITIRFSPLGKEEEEEEEEEVLSPLPLPAVAECGDQGVVTAEEASEDMFELAGGVNYAGEGSADSPPPVPPSPAHGTAHPSLEQKAPPSPHSPASSSSPSRSTPPPTKPFFSLVKPGPLELFFIIIFRVVLVLSGAGLPPGPTAVSAVHPASRIHGGHCNIGNVGGIADIRRGDSKTAPSSPRLSPESRPFFKVQEVEARLEDTRRRLSEAVYEPFQRLSKIIGDEGGATRLKSMSSSATELTSLVGFNGQQETNNNNDYCIKEEEGSDSEGESTTAGKWSPGSVRVGSWSIGGFGGSRVSALGFDRCTMSALAKQDDEDFVEVYSDCVDEGAELGESSGPCPAEGAGGLSEEAEDRERAELPDVPYVNLLALTSLVYCCLILPLPTYLAGALIGVALGFMLAMLFVWLSAPRRSGNDLYYRNQCRSESWNKVEHLDIGEPGIFKGWMNQIYRYDPETYHATLTHSIFVRLEGSVLRLSKPSRNIARRASFNESKPDVSYVSQRIYDLTDSNIYLVPPNLARKRVWNKKYPICIELGKQDDFLSLAHTSKEGAVEERGSAGETVKGTGREKEEWFRRLTVASKLRSEAKKTQSLPGSRSAFVSAHSLGSSQSGGLNHSRSSSSSLDELLTSSSQPRPRELSGSVRQKMLLDYSVYMAQYVPLQSTTPTFTPVSPANSPVDSAASSPGPSKKLPSSPTEEAEPDAWVNALLGRIFWDFLGEKHWAGMVSKKIQMKLSKIRLPYFMNELTLTELDMGVAVPKILQASKPSVDYQGLWFDLDISYNGSFLMTLQTKMNLAKLGKEAEGLRFGESGKDGPRPRVYCLADSDEESSSAGSSDEEEPPEMPADKGSLPGTEGYVGGYRPSKIMRFVDKITKSKYFQKATETEFIKKKMEEVSNTPLLLTVEVQECRGKLAVNIPPPPTDRIWYGFRSPPHLELKARPKLGEREVTLAHVTDWIEKKLEQEFQKIFVMPNMDDVWLPIMHSAMDTRSNPDPAVKDLSPSDSEGGALGEM